jgi:hypothetical protein
MLFHFFLARFYLRPCPRQNPGTRKAAPKERRPCLKYQLIAIATITTAVAAAATITSAAAATTVTAAAAATAFTAATETAAAAARTLFARTGDIHGQSAIVELRAVEGLHGLLGFFFSGHRHETETAGAAGHAIRHEVRFEDRAVLGERVLKLVFRNVEGKISNKQFVIHSVMSEGRYRNCNPNCSRPSGFKSSLKLCSTEDLPYLGGSK